jgi:hypothetical protein
MNWKRSIPFFILGAICIVMSLFAIPVLEENYQVGILGGIPFIGLTVFGAIIAGRELDSSGWKLSEACEIKVGLGAGLSIFLIFIMLFLAWSVGLSVYEVIIQIGQKIFEESLKFLNSL